MDTQDVFAPSNVRLVDQHLAIETAGTEERRIENFWAVGRAHDDDALAAVKAIHLREQLIERLLPLLVAAHRRLDTDLAECVEFIDEDDARRFHFCLGEEVAHARCADPDEHLDELRPAQAEERDLGLSGDGSREQGLSGTRRADEEDAFGDAPANGRVLPRVLEEFDNFSQLVFRFVDAGHVSEPDFYIIVCIDLGAAASEGHDAPLGTTHTTKEETPERDQENDRDYPADQFGQPFIGRLAGELDARSFEVFNQLGIFNADRDERVRALRPTFHDPADPVVGDDDLLDGAVAHALLELAVGDRFASLHGEVEGLPERQQQKHREHVPHGRARARPRRQLAIA